MTSWRGPRTLVLAAAVGIALIATAFGMTVARAVQVEIHTHPAKWVSNIIPAVLSELYFGYPKRYLTLRSVREVYFRGINAGIPSADQINPAIRRVAQLNPREVGDAIDLLGPDDKGIVDFTRFSFQLFGFQVESVTVLYFTVLLVSCLLFIIAFWRSPSALLLLVTFLAMLYLSLPMVAYNLQLQSILALRALPVLSMVACLHCLLFMASSLRVRVSAIQLGLVVAQVALITFTMHLRTTTLWQVMTIAGFGIVVLGVASIRRLGVATIPWRQTALAVTATLGLSLAGYVGLQSYHAVAIPDEYRQADEIATRVFWHNIFSGLAFHPDLGERFELRIDDRSVFLATRAYLRRSNRMSVWRDMGGESAGIQGLKFAKYEPVVREMFFRQCSRFFQQCAEAMLYYKPLALLGDLAWLYGLRPLPYDLDITTPRGASEESAVVKHQFIDATVRMDQRGQRAYLWTPSVLLLILPFAYLLTFGSRQSAWIAFASCVGLALGSTIPIVVGYPLPHTILEPAITFGMVTYLVVCLAAAALLPGLLARSQQHRPASEASSPSTRRAEPPAPADQGGTTAG